MSTPSWDVYWPRDFVGRTLSGHPLEARDGTLWCRSCDVVVGDSGLHLMMQLRNRPGPETLPAGVERDPRESSIDWGAA